MVRMDDSTVTFRWKNRAAGNRREISTVPGVEFVRRYLRHVLPRGLCSIRYYGFCHPAARAKRLRVQCHAGGPVQFGAMTPPPAIGRGRSFPWGAHAPRVLRTEPSRFARGVWRGIASGTPYAPGFGARAPQTAREARTLPNAPPVATAVSPSRSR
jgi:hypothetical protein